jgi:alpha-L-fucosidase
MQERLLQIGKWLKMNGDAIYGTKPWTRTRQWSEGNQPKLETGEYMTKYEVTDYIQHKKPGQAVIETFFTSKGDDVYAILPGWPGPKLTLKSVTAPASMKVSMLGAKNALKWSKSGSGIEIEMPQDSGHAFESEVAMVVKLPGLKAAK